MGTCSGDSRLLIHFAYWQCYFWNWSSDHSWHIQNPVFLNLNNAIEDKFWLSFAPCGLACLCITWCLANITSHLGLSADPKCNTCWLCWPESPVLMITGLFGHIYNFNYYDRLSPYWSACPPLSPCGVESGDSFLFWVGVCLQCQRHPDSSCVLTSKTSFNGP